MWHENIVSTLVKKREIITMRNKAVTSKYNELKKAIESNEVLQATTSVTLNGVNTIKVNEITIDINYGEVIQRLIKNYRIKPMDATQNDIDSVVENILEEKLSF